ncbi:hypothetical protein [Bdellovibrio sp.]|uniref:hypothetical protein n=1 Tax=Bdellovibrio sp. TaxID=28201 RepID=UPI0039E286FD
MKLRSLFALLPTFFAALIFAGSQSLGAKSTAAEDTEIHDHDGKEEHDHKEEAEHGHDKEGHDHEEEEVASVGPDKGITEFREVAGFKLSPEAIRNFGMKVQNLSGKGPWTVPSSSVLYSGEEINVYRVRKGFIKRVDFSSIFKDSKIVKIQSSDLKEGDQIVIEGIGYLRAAEIVATGGAPEGHSH